jgi:hypothetical protein
MVVCPLSWPAMRATCAMRVTMLESARIHACMHTMAGCHLPEHARVPAPASRGRTACAPTGRPSPPAGRGRHAGCPLHRSVPRSPRRAGPAEGLGEGLSTVGDGAGERSRPRPAWWWRGGVAPRRHRGSWAASTSYAAHARNLNGIGLAGCVVGPRCSDADSCNSRPNEARLFKYASTARPRGARGRASRSTPLHPANCTYTMDGRPTETRYST